MDNLHYRLTFDLDNKNEIPGKNLWKVVKFQNLVEKYCNVCYKVYQFSHYCVTPEIVTTFGSKMVTISARNTIIRKFANFAGLYFRIFYNIFPPNFGILLLLKGSFREFLFFAWIWLDQKLVYNANRPFKLYLDRYFCIEL